MNPHTNCNATSIKNTIGVGVKKALIFIVRFYRNYLSPFKLQCCRFYPSCSEYAIDAIEKHGLFKGVWRGLKRVLRCHPFSGGGYDPA